jgi:DNA (cytosine-5)-methyltransferase 1
MTAYYNEIDPFAAAWLRELIKDGLIAPGDVDERSIEDVVPIELAAYTQCHFFAGIGGWSLALRMAGWPDDRPVFTGSAPCQPFSTAGKGNGFADDRHLWPSFLWHIQQCGPRTIFGEQVASADALRWWDVVAADLEDSDYACTAVNLCAAGVGAPHIRQRLFWVAHTNKVGCGTRGRESKGSHEEFKGRTPKVRSKDWAKTEALSNAFGVANTNGKRREKQRQSLATGSEYASDKQSCCWDSNEWITCIDGKQRPIKPGILPLAHGVPNRVGTLRGAGNAIVPQVAAEFVKSYLAS